MSRLLGLISTVWLTLLLLAAVLPAYAAAPTINSFSPTSGKVGDTVTITGSDFTDATAVTFNGITTATYTVVSAISITATVPTDATTGKITVTTPDGTATSVDDFIIWISSSLDITVDPGWGYIGALSGITLHYSLTGPEAYTGAVSLNDTGKVSISSIRPGSYTLSLFSSHWLRRTISSIDLITSKSITVSLTNGDADGNNQVNLFDFVALDTNFSTATANADLDGSGHVNLFDYVIIDSCFGAKSDSDGMTKVNPIDGAVMVWVPAGDFLRGTNPPAGHIDEWPQRTIYLNGYWIYKYEVTVAQYRAFCEATKRTMPPAPSWGWQDTHPMVNVVWQQAVDYASWAGVSLPTEAQWEKAARGTDGRIYPWGNDWEKSKCVNNTTSPLNTMPVGSYPSGVSPYGCIDMAGNAWEWCADWLDLNYYPSAPNNNPQSPASGSSRVLRGGSWVDTDDYYFRCASRLGSIPDIGGPNIGFRCAKME